MCKGKHGPVPLEGRIACFAIVTPTLGCLLELSAKQRPHSILDDSSYLIPCTASFPQISSKQIRISKPTCLPSVFLLWNVYKFDHFN